MSKQSGRRLERVYVEAILIGLCIGLAALALDTWVGDRSWRMRIAGLVVVGGLLCALQYGVVWLRKR